MDLNQLIHLMIRLILSTESSLNDRSYSNHNYFQEAVLAYDCIMIHFLFKGTLFFKILSKRWLFLFKNIYFGANKASDLSKNAWGANPFFTYNNWIIAHKFLQQKVYIFLQKYFM